MSAEWDRFKFDDFNELTTVRHIAHVPAARRIVEDGRNRPRPDLDHVGGTRFGLAATRITPVHSGEMMSPKSVFLYAFDLPKE